VEADLSFDPEVFTSLPEVVAMFMLVQPGVQSAGSEPR